MRGRRGRGGLASRLRFRFHIVRSVDRNDERALFRLCGRGDRGIGIPSCKIDGMPQRRQLRQTRCQIVHAGALAVGTIQRERRIFAALQNGRDQTGKARAGSDFEKRANARGVHVCDLVHKLDGASELSGKKVAGGVRIVGIRLGSGVGVDDCGAGMKRDVGEGGSQWFGGGSHEWTVKRGGDAQSLRANLTGIERSRRACDEIAWAG